MTLTRNRNLQGLPLIATVYILLLVLKFACESLEAYTLSITGQKIMYDMRMQIYQHLQRVDVQYYDRNPVGRLMTRVSITAAGGKTRSGKCSE